MLASEHSCGQVSLLGPDRSERVLYLYTPRSGALGRLTVAEQSDSVLSSEKILEGVRVYSLYQLTGFPVWCAKHKDDHIEK